MWIILSLLNIIPIADIRENDATGKPLKEGELVEITGIITASVQFGDRGPATIQDSSFGVALYDDKVSSLNIGDSVIISGKVTLYNGLTELTSITVNVLENLTPPDPEEITVNDLSERDGYTELYESKLVVIRNVTIKEEGIFKDSVYNYTIEDKNGDTALIYIDKDTDIIGKEIPQGSVDIIGVVSQYDRSSPYWEGYELKPRMYADFQSHHGIVDKGLIRNSSVVKVFDINGRLVYNGKYADFKDYNLKNGIYFSVFKYKSELSVKKLIVVEDKSNED